MAKILFTGTSGTDDPTQATLPFGSACGALKAGHEPIIYLFNEAVYLMKDVIASDVKGFGWPALSEFLKEVVEHKVSIYV